MTAYNQFPLELKLHILKLLIKLPFSTSKDVQSYFIADTDIRNLMYHKGYSLLCAKINSLRHMEYYPGRWHEYSRYFGKARWVDGGSFSAGFLLSSRNLETFVHRMVGIIPNT